MALAGDRRGAKTLSFRDKNHKTLLSLSNCFNDWPPLNGDPGSPTPLVRAGVGVGVKATNVKRESFLCLCLSLQQSPIRLLLLFFVKSLKKRLNSPEKRNLIFVGAMTFSRSNTLGVHLE